MGSESLEFYLDFKSPSCFVALASLETVSRDYKVNVIIRPYLTSNTKFLQAKNAAVHTRDQKLGFYRFEEAKRYAELQGLSLLDSGIAVESSIGLCGILWINKVKPSAAIEFCKKAFQATWLKRQKPNHLSLVSPLNIDAVVHILRSCGIDCDGFPEFVAAVRDNPLPLLRAGGSLNRPVFGVPCFYLPSMDKIFYSQYTLSMVRYLLHIRGLQRRPDVIPDITCAFRLPEPKLSPETYGMPGTGLVKNRLERYRNRSLKIFSNDPSIKMIDVYLDLKSPHAYLAIEMTRALEEDFNVNVNFLPYSLPITDIYGNATKNKIKPARNHKQGKMVNTRNSMQLKMVRYGYSLCRELAGFQNTIIMGTPKVYDSTFGCYAILWAKSFGRKYLDMFLDYTFPLMWKRMLDIEDVEQVKECLTRSDVPLKLHTKKGLLSFDEYIVGEGREVFKNTMDHATKIKVMGVPTYVVDDQVYFGKEHLSLIRYNLKNQGFNLKPDSPVDVPYLWRPMNTDTSTAKL